MPAVGSSAGAGAAAGDGGPSICEVGGGGNLLPLFGDAEQTWPKALRGILYLIGLGWCFCGVALISEVFMGAIETITSQKKRKMNRETGRMITVCVWNPTVANLTLMALGSSAPEILLSIIELLGNSFFGGELGPSTIVGSAAFNLLCITAVCVVAIPDKEVRRIKEMSVYAVTSAFSIFAYLWLLVILLGFSRDVIEIWEGVLTFLFFPMLVGLAYVADQGYFSRIPNFGGGRQKIIVDADMSKEELAELEASIRRKHGSDLTDEQVARLISAEHEPPPSRAAYRVQAIRGMTGGKRVNTPCQVDTAVPPLNSIVPFEGGELPAHRSDSASFDVSFEFEAVRHAVLESVGDLELPITRLGNEDVHASVAVRTRDGTAKSNQDYMPIDTRVKFPPGVTKQTVTLSIVDDNETEENEEFYVELHEAQAVNCTACVGRIASTTIVIIDDDLPGTLEFQDDSWTIVQDAEDKVIEVIVQRKGGGNGKVSCRYCTEDGTAISPADFERAEGTVEFEHGQMVSVIPVKIKGAGRYERSENFRVVLSEPCGGAKLDPKSDGGAESTILTVIIKSEHTTKARIDKLWQTMSVNWDRTQVGHRNWKEQFVSALYANGGGDTEETQSDPTLFDHIVHGVLLPWKLLFALVPPTDYMNGWVCFCVSLLFIGGLTAVIGDMANLLGCVLQIPSEITAITFVALGTSLPDTFASKQAALQATHADASIGNVTGSNSVNVFLGLGLPWMMASIYWTISGPNDEWRRKYGSLPAGREWPNGAFVVPADGLGFSVLVFSGCAILCIAVLYLRRRYAGGELGGSVNAKFATAFLFVGLWLTYVGLSAWYIMSRK